MPAKIVSVANQKGGAGKTTVSMLLAGALCDAGFRVQLVDADRQGSATDWSANAPDGRPFPARIANLAAAGARLPAEVRKYTSDVDVIVIDCPPSVESLVTQAALMVSDLVLIPLVPAPADYTASSAFFGLVESVEAVNGTLQKRIVPNMVTKTALADSLMKAMAELSVPRTKTALMTRSAYREAMAHGATIETMKAPQAAKDEVASLVKEVINLLQLAAPKQPPKKSSSKKKSSKKTSRRAAA